MTNKCTLLTLPGEIQNNIIANLDALSATALRYTSQYFKRIIPLPPLSRDRGEFHRIECATWHPSSHEFACYTCCQMKPRREFTPTQTKGKRGKNGARWEGRRCAMCLIREGQLSSGFVIKSSDGTEIQAVCGACATIQRKWCIDCKWCRQCAAKRSAIVWRNGQWADHKWSGNLVIVRTLCKKHRWKKSAEPQSASPLTKQ